MQLKSKHSYKNFVYALLISLSWSLRPVVGYPELFVRRYGSDCKAKPNPNQQYGSHGTPMWDRPGVGFTITQWGRNILKHNLTATERYNITVYFENPRHALVYSSWGKLDYTDKPTPPGRPCPNRLAFGPASGYDPATSFTFEIVVPTNAPTVDVTAISSNSELSRFLVGRVTLELKFGTPRRALLTASAGSLAFPGKPRSRTELWYGQAGIRGCVNRLAFGQQEGLRSQQGAQGEAQPAQSRRRQRDAGRGVCQE
ncbi:hypothetical protein OEZ86_013979 [Tetradesmus obliquus]|nr:hypothetical protein OEZ86_013979 [Tetradesmus obliquus]